MRAKVTIHQSVYLTRESSFILAVTLDTLCERKTLFVMRLITNYSVVVSCDSAICAENMRALNCVRPVRNSV